MFTDNFSLMMTNSLCGFIQLILHLKKWSPVYSGALGILLLEKFLGLFC